MLAKYIFGALGGCFLIAGSISLATHGRNPQGRTWLLIGAIFAAVSLWLFSRG